MGVVLGITSAVRLARMQRDMDQDAYVVYERIAGSGGYLYPAFMVGREHNGNNDNGKTEHKGV